MRAILTRVSSASVTIDGERVGQIGKGFLILLGVGPDDGEKECRALAEKCLALRIFDIRIAVSYLKRAVDSVIIAPCRDADCKVLYISRYREGYFSVFGVVYQWFVQKV